MADAPPRHGTPGDPPAVVLVLLAAGAGSRFEGPHHKLHASIDGEHVIARSLAAAVASGAGPVVVVTGATEHHGIITPDPAMPDISALHTATPDTAAATTTTPDTAAAGIVSVVRNPDWADGQSTSLHAGIAEAARRGASAVVVGLADQPFVEPEAWRLVAASTSPIAVATYDGRRRNPVRLHRDVWPLLPTTGDEGARSLIRMRPDLVEEIPCPGSPADIDTQEDLRTWQNRSSTNSR